MECKTSRLVEKKPPKEKYSREDINSKEVSVSVLVCSSCHTKYHRLDGLKNKNLFSHSSEKSKTKVPDSSVPSEGSRLGLLSATFWLYPHREGEVTEKASSLVSLIRALPPS